MGKVDPTSNELENGLSQEALKPHDPVQTLEGNLCADCLEQGFHERAFNGGKESKRLYKFFCCAACGDEQTFKHSKDMRKSSCNGCHKAKAKLKVLQKKGYAGTDAKGNPLVRCEMCRETFRFKGTMTREEARNYRCRGCQK